MVSRKMALINLFKGNEWRCRMYRMDLWTQWGEREWDEWKNSINIYTIRCKMDS